MTTRNRNARYGGLVAGVCLLFAACTPPTDVEANRERTQQGNWQIMVTPSVIDFGTRDTSETVARTITISNSSSTMPLVLSSIRLENNIPQVQIFQPTALPVTLAPRGVEGSTTQIMVTFKPVGDETVREGIFFNDMTTPLVSVVGTGHTDIIPPPPDTILWAEDLKLRLGRAEKDTATLTGRVMNLGNEPIVLSGATITGPDADKFTFRPAPIFPLVLPPKESWQFRQRVVGPGPGVYRATIVFETAGKITRIPGQLFDRESVMEITVD